MKESVSVAWAVQELLKIEVKIFCQVSSPGDNLINGFPAILEL